MFQNSLFLDLRIVDLSHNGFVGPLPTKYFNLWNAMVDVDKENTKYWHAYDNYMLNGLIGARPYPYSMTITNKGVKMEYAKVLKIFSAVDLSCNKFDGEIPDVVGGLKGNLKNLKALDLSQNKLVGNIPTQLTQLNFLEVFNVSYNYLTGLISKG
ncbi:hypothetical protein SLA2020_015890 [Shorea laevis]